jgi:arylsulfatase A-like enzyme
MLRIAAAGLALALLGAALGCGRETRRDVLLVSVDTLRADRLGAYGDDRGLTPHLDALAAQSSVFERAYAPAPFTLPSVTALLTGRYPEEAGVRTNLAVVAEGLPTLASELRARGWRTGAVVGNFVLRRRTGLARGFERFDDHFPTARAGAPPPERAAAAVTDAALALLDELSAGAEPVFLWVHYQDPHGPYTPPPGYRERNLERERREPGGTLHLEPAADDRGMGGIPPYQQQPGQTEVALYRAGYAGEVQYADEQIGRLLAELRPGGRLAAAVVVFTADHGESLGEGGQWFAHGELLSDAVLHVPLLVRVPGRPPERRRDLASLLDLLPTLAGLLGVEPPQGARGRDLLAPGAASQQETLYASTLLEASQPRLGVLHGERRLVLSPAADAHRRELYRLGDDSRDLADAEPEQVKSLQGRLARLRAGLEMAGPRERPLDAAEREALRGLGYATGAPP